MDMSEPNVKELMSHVAAAIKSYLNENPDFKFNPEELKKGIAEFLEEMRNTGPIPALNIPRFSEGTYAKTLPRPLDISDYAKPIQKFTLHTEVPPESEILPNGLHYYARIKDYGQRTKEEVAADVELWIRDGLQKGLDDWREPAGMGFKVPAPEVDYIHTRGRDILHEKGINAITRINGLVPVIYGCSVWIGGCHYSINQATFIHAFTELLLSISKKEGTGRDAMLGVIACLADCYQRRILYDEPQMIWNEGSVQFLVKVSNNVELLKFTLRGIDQNGVTINPEVEVIRYNSFSLNGIVDPISVNMSCLY